MRSDSLNVSGQPPRKSGVLRAIVGVGWFLNFAIYVGVASWIGGEAINGHEEGGRYYLAMHGALTEVSHNLFVYSKIHTYFLWVHTGVLLLIALFERLRRQPRAE